MGRPVRIAVLSTFLAVAGASCATASSAPDAVASGPEPEAGVVLTSESLSRLSSLFRRHYPALLRDAGVEGEARVRFLVLPSGSVDPRSIRILNASHHSFSQATERLVAQLEFLPPHSGGEPVAVWTRGTLEWRTEGPRAYFRPMNAP